ncbi:MAG: hypothetical protein FJZ86_09915 [Chloroflexi bacterium]|nr:hypothetical protein [Chloroflexota bacterium]
MNASLNKIAAILAFIIGAMAVFAGGQVLLGKLPDYYVINWLPGYNYTVGILTVFVTAILLWMNHRLAMPIAIATFGVHTLVMLVIQTAYRDVVATDSIMAMTIRMTVWIIILALMYFQSQKK